MKRDSVVVVSVDVAGRRVEHSSVPLTPSQALVWEANSLRMWQKHPGGVKVEIRKVVPEATADPLCHSCGEPLISIEIPRGICEECRAATEARSAMDANCVQIIDGEGLGRAMAVAVETYFEWLRSPSGIAATRVSTAARMLAAMTGVGEVDMLLAIAQRAKMASVGEVDMLLAIAQRAKMASP